MTRGPYHPGKVWRASIPAEHVIGNEIHDNPDKGPRPWVILYSRGHKKSGLVIAAPIRSKGGQFPEHIYFTDDEVESRVNNWAGREGYICLDQMRALSVDRMEQPLGTLQDRSVKKIRATLEGMLTSSRMVREYKGK